MGSSLRILAQKRADPRSIQTSLPDPSGEVIHEDFDIDEPQPLLYPADAADIVDAAEIQNAAHEMEETFAHERELTWKSKHCTKTHFRKEPRYQSFILIGACLSTP